MQMQQISGPALYFQNIEHGFSKSFSSCYWLLFPNLMLVWNVVIGNNFGDIFKKLLM